MFPSSDSIQYLFTRIYSSLDFCCKVVHPISNLGVGEGYTLAYNQCWPK